MSSYIYTVLNCVWPSEGNPEADVAPGENEFDTPGIVVRQLYNLQSDTLNNSSTHLAPYSCYNIIGYILYAELHIPMTILKLPIPSHFSPIPPTPSLLATIKMFSVSTNLFLFCLLIYFVL